MSKSLDGQKRSSKLIGREKRKEDTVVDSKNYNRDHASIGRKSRISS